VKVKGTCVKWCDRGYGWLSVDCNGEDVFVHVTDSPDGLPILVGSRLRFTVREAPKGLRASDVELITEPANGSRSGVNGG
jgi:cold shock CspA family protein